jgi:hypothetical protein
MASKVDTVMINDVNGFEKIKKREKRERKMMHWVWNVGPES